MPKKLSRKINKLFHASIQRRFDAEAQKQRDETTQGLDHLNRTFVQQCNLYTNGNPIIFNQAIAVCDGFQDQLTQLQQCKDRVAALEREVIASRLKLDSGMKLGFWERRRFEKNEKKLEASEWVLQNAKDAIDAHYAFQTRAHDTWSIDDPRHWYGHQIKALIENAKMTPAEAMQEKREEHLREAGWEIGHDLDAYCSGSAPEHVEEFKRETTDSLEDVHEAFESSHAEPEASRPEPVRQQVELGIRSATLQAAQQAESAPAQAQAQAEHSQEKEPIV